MRALLFVVLLLSAPAGALAQSAVPPDAPELPDLSALNLAAVVGLEATILPEARTAEYLGARRQGSGVVIDATEGLVLTIGYVVLEAAAVDILIGDADAGSGRRVPAEVVAYDYDSGFGLLRASQPLELEAMPIGEASGAEIRQTLLTVSYGGDAPIVAPVLLVSRREFAGYWEYLLPDALFTAPHRPDWSGAALLDAKGRLLGIGSLQVPDALGSSEAGGPLLPGNMFVPIDALKPIYSELVSFGRNRRPPHPWLGLNAQELRGRVVVTRTTDGAPAAEAGIEEGEIVAAVAGEPVTGLADFYRKLWALGDAGVEVPLTVEGPDGTRQLTVKSADRYDFLRLDQTL